MTLTLHIRAIEAPSSPRASAGGEAMRELGIFNGGAGKTKILHDLCDEFLIYDTSVLSHKFVDK